MAINSNTAIPLGLQKVPNLQEIKLVAASGIYFLCRDGEVIYIGQASCAMARLGQHLAENRKQFDAAFFLPTPLDQLNDVEIKFIKLLNPPSNKGGAPKYQRGKRTRKKALANEISENTILGIYEICQRLNRSSRFVRQLIRDKKLVAWKGAKRWETTEANLRVYIETIRMS